MYKEYDRILGDLFNIVLNKKRQLDNASKILSEMILTYISYAEQVSIQCDGDGE